MVVADGDEVSLERETKERPYRAVATRTVAPLCLLAKLIGAKEQPNSSNLAANLTATPMDTCYSGGHSRNSTPHFPARNQATDTADKSHWHS